jgi:hypothetical protein
MGGRFYSLAHLLLFWELVRTAVAAPYALHQLVVVDTAGDAVIRLSGYDTVVASNKVGLTFLAWLLKVGRLVGRMIGN